ncbi:MAG: ABC transporter ATP-binding protein [Gammaproteobacteria bacterium]|nr:ABC transporter ATP-binding protein [Gammaproteobacteria bacterium]
MSDQSQHPVVEVRGVGKRVASPEGELELLRDIQFSIRAGEAVAVLGASGSGKTTLLGILAGLDTPSDGTVLIEGVDLFALDEEGRAAVRREAIGFVFQSFHLLPTLTAAENVMLPLELAGRADARVQAEQLLARVGLERRLRHYPRQLSGGEQQRVAIARAFATRPRLLFADEPTGNLDLATGRRVIDLLFDINREQGTTLVLVTHDDTVAARCTRRLLLDGGRLRDAA